MAKNQKIFICEICGYRSSKWLGKCPSCGNWNSFREVDETKSSGKKQISNKLPIPIPVNEAKKLNQKRIITGIEEFDRVLGGGIVEGSVTLIGGQPGIGKSTLLLQIAGYLARKGLRILYISGEESVEQIAMRAKRLNTNLPEILLLSETNFSVTENSIYKADPDIVIIDSVQTLYAEEIGTAPGSVIQVREIAYRATQLAKAKGVPFFLVGHVTKVGNIAGPNLLEHIVDTVLYFEGDKTSDLRILRSTKNRFGPTNEIGIFEMTQEGLKEVSNPSALFLEGREENIPGSSVTVAMEGSRPFLVEIQALVSPSPFGMPRRTVVGIDPNRISILIAVLEKRAHLHIGGQDIFINVVGGLRLQEPTSDLAIIMAIVSSFREEPFPRNAVALGEVGLVGEIRRIKDLEKRVKESLRSGFEKIIIPEVNLKDLKTIDQKNIIGVKNVAQAINTIFSNSN